MKALVLSGGGSKGAWQVGVLHRLLQEEQNDYQIVTGISVGAVNGAFLAQFKSGEEREALGALKKVWFTVTPKRIRKHWLPFGWLHALWKTSLYDSKPLWKLVGENLDPKKVQASGKLLRIGSVDLVTGNYVLTDQTSDDLVTGVVASASYPMFFKTVEVDGKMHTDGGVRHIAPLKAALDMGATSIDVLITETSDLRTWTEKKPNVLDVGIRTIEIMNDQHIRGDLKLAATINKMVKSNSADPRYKYVPIRVFEPSVGLGDGLDFSQRLVQERMEQGVLDAETWRAL